MFGLIMFAALGLWGLAGLVCGLWWRIADSGLSHKWRMALHALTVIAPVLTMAWASAILRNRGYDAFVAVSASIGLGTVLLGPFYYIFVVVLWARTRRPG